MADAAKPLPTVVLLSQGDEIITGQTVDTNAAWMAERLTDLGFSVTLKLAVGDRLDDIVQALRLAASQGDVLICSGGLGPTVDDLTTEAVGVVSGQPLVEDTRSLERIRAAFARFGREMSPSNRKQALLPQGATILDNDWGTAPGFSTQLGACVAYFVPGVPREMRGFFTHHIAPDLTRRFTLEPGRLVMLRCMGIAESKLEDLLKPFQDIPGVVLGFRTRMPENQVKLRCAASLGDAAIAELTQRVHDTIGSSVFGINSGPVEQVVGELLRARGATVATAESCTGGQISGAITSIPGASDYFLEGACVYANAAKIRTCGVDPATLEAHGAVSEPVARAMAEGIRARAGATYGISSTGIAGPGGGTPDKPVGTVWIALATPTTTHARLLRLPGDRERVTCFTTGAALDLLRRELQGLLDAPNGPS